MINMSREPLQAFATAPPKREREKKQAAAIMAGVYRTSICIGPMLVEGGGWFRRQVTQHQRDLRKNSVKLGLSLAAGF